MNEFQFSDIEVGLKESFSKTITKEMEDSFRIVSGDDNPLHRDDEFAKEVSNGRYACHATFGMLTASMFSTLAGMYIPGKYSLIHSLEDLSFPNPVFVGDKLTVTGEVIGKEEAFNLIFVKAVIKNQNNKTVSKARMKILVMR